MSKCLQVLESNFSPLVSCFNQNMFFSILFRNK